ITKVLYWCLHHPFELNRYFAASPPETDLFTSSESNVSYLWSSTPQPGLFGNVGDVVGMRLDDWQEPAR
ncbi:MAG: hypothetical protein ABFS45_26115, partial [Pseudomonadota bacterium]